MDQSLVLGGPSMSYKSMDLLRVFSVHKFTFAIDCHMKYSLKIFSAIFHGPVIIISHKTFNFLI